VTTDNTCLKIFLYEGNLGATYDKCSMNVAPFTVKNIMLYFFLLLIDIKLYLYINCVVHIIEHLDVNVFLRGPKAHFQTSNIYTLNLSLSHTRREPAQCRCYLPSSVDRNIKVMTIALYWIYVYIHIQSGSNMTGTVCM
jgi:hypothetical protein